MNSVRFRLVVTFSLFCTSLARADDAITHQGRRFSGTLHTDAFLIEDSNKKLAFAEIQFVRFPERPAPLPHCRLLHQLLLSGEQKLVGELRSVTDSQVEFALATGKIEKLPRERIQGIIQADGDLVHLADDFDKGSFQWLGKPVFDTRHVFSGKRSLLFGPVSGDLEVRLPPSRISDWRATVHFYTKSGTANFQFGLRAEKGKASVPLRLDAKEYVAGSDYRYLLGSPAWHIVQLDVGNGEAKMFVDDYLLGRSPVPREAQLTSIHVAPEGGGSLWLDGFSLVERRCAAGANARSGRFG